MADALDGIRLKLIRAYQQMQSLEHEINVFNDLKPFTAFPPKRNADATEHIFHLRITQPFPLMWGVRLREIAHDLRSALDQCIYVLTVVYVGDAMPKVDLLKVLDHTSFPMFIDSAKYPKKGLPGSIKNVGAGVQAYIKRLQPYRRGKPLNEALGSLYELWNQDKRRVIQPWGVRIFDELTDLGVENVVGEYTATVASGVLHHGAEAVRITPPSRAQVCR